MKSSLLLFFLFPLFVLCPACDKAGEKVNPSNNPSNNPEDGQGHTGEIRVWKAADLKTALDKAVTRVRTELGANPNVLDMKSWNAKENVAVKVTVEIAAVRDPRYFLCHLHGTTMSCHKSKTIPEGEPSVSAD